MNNIVVAYHCLQKSLMQSDVHRVYTLLRICRIYEIRTPYLYRFFTCRHIFSLDIKKFRYQDSHRDLAGRSLQRNRSSDVITILRHLADVSFGGLVIRSHYKLLRHHETSV